MEAYLACEGAVALKLGVAVAGYFVHFVEACPCEVDAGLAVMTIQSALNGAKYELSASVGGELDLSGAEQVDEVSLPQLHPGNPPLADHRMVVCRHGVTPSSLGNRIRLAAAAVRVTIQPTRPMPRWRVFRSPAAALIQPNGSSIRLRMRWLMA